MRGGVGRGYGGRCGFGLAKGFPWRHFEEHNHQLRRRQVANEEQQKRGASQGIVKSKVGNSSKKYV